MTEIHTKLRNLIEQNTDESNREVINILKQFDGKLYDILYPNGESLLHWACAFNNPTMCEYLINGGLHVNLENYRGTAPLYYACMNNAGNSIKVMIKHRANPFQRSGFSGDFPVEILTDDLCELLEDYSNRMFPFLKLDDNHKLSIMSDNKVLTYKYRKYMMVLSTLFYLYNPIKHTLLDWHVDLESKKVYEKDGIVGLVGVCNKLYQEYFEELDRQSEQCCLACNKPNVSKKCSKCKMAYYCNLECQKVAHKLHKFDCLK
jgi:hypothetical protein